VVRRPRQANNTGTKLFQISGHVERPCVVEEEMGIRCASCSTVMPAVCAAAGTICWPSSRRLVDAVPAVHHLPDLTLDFDTLSKLKPAWGLRP
jgi:NADH-quinone oxidoreductase subunit F